MHQTPFQRLERMFEEFPHTEMPFGSESHTAAVDVAERDDEFVVTCDLPGFDRDNIDLRVTDHTLHVHAEHESEQEVEDEEYLHRERTRRDVSRSIPLPEDIDEEDVSATFEDGVLTVTLPRRHGESEETHEISIS
ncbi:MAG: Hsp20/alpha crystallin family protein [Halorientalis sp.]